METTTHQVIDPRGDILLCFPRQPGHHPQDGSTSTPPHPPDGMQTSSELPSRQTTCSACASTHDGPSRSITPISTNDGDTDPTDPSNTVNLLVSSSVLCLASQVFSAMLSGGMAEAKAFQAEGSPRPYPITLHEDDGQVFALLANVIHFQSQNVPPLPSAVTLLSLAFLVDKYDCAAAVRCQAEIWVNRAIECPDYGSFERRCDLLIFTYALDLPAPFFQISWDVILNHRQQLKSEIEFGVDLPFAKDHGLLRHDIHAAIAKRKARLRREVHHALMEPVSRVTGILVKPGEASGVKDTCRNAALSMGNYLAFLDLNNLCPWRAQYETDSFSSIIKCALEAAALAKAEKALIFERCTSPEKLPGQRSWPIPCGCKYIIKSGDSVNMAEALASSLEGALKWKL
ncbi:hypothetical protein B0T14DRAFT_520313 [Immersiella caudata]|uniref:BTB domain-containing protein n=1 Tax=Immersiella caudata TaxID=314043 RepID=A0AA39WQY7_9PEZI|nr:hypothetical protein B0T14DRAFT_520313 [Immersiella caudata]